MLKSRSVNVNRKPREIFSEVREELVSKSFKVRNIIYLERYSKDHAAFFVEV
jgi:fibrillarin-like rRNA methylase